jgi:hypothetical protein
MTPEDIADLESLRAAELERLRRAEADRRQAEADALRLRQAAEEQARLDAERRREEKEATCHTLKYLILGCDYLLQCVHLSKGFSENFKDFSGNYSIYPRARSIFFLGKL